MPDPHPNLELGSGILNWDPLWIWSIMKCSSSAPALKLDSLSHSRDSPPGNFMHNVMTCKCKSPPASVRMLPVEDSASFAGQ
jgi:hypothetical protein